MYIYVCIYKYTRKCIYIHNTTYKDVLHVHDVTTLSPESGERQQQQQRGSFPAQFLSLADTMQRLGHAHVHIVKMDIEGAEVEVIAWFQKSPIKIAKEPYKDCKRAL